MTTFSAKENYLKATPRPAMRTYSACVILLAFLVCACSVQNHGTTQSDGQIRQLGLKSGPVSNASPPKGWYRVLNGMRFTDQIASRGLAVSIARPERIAGCVLPSQSGSNAHATFLLSDDGGRSWQAHPIDGISESESCTVLADAQQPNRFVVAQPGNGAGIAPIAPSAYMTVDSGHTWQVIAPPSSSDGISIARETGALVGGHFFAVAHQSGGYHLQEMDASGNWHVVDVPALGVGGSKDVPQTIAVDPENPQRIYAAFFNNVNSPQGMIIYLTENDGISWRPVLQLPHAQRIALWTAKGGRVYVQQTIGGDTSYQFYYSRDYGTTWIRSGLHHRGADAIFVSPTGRVLTIADNLVFNLDPMTGAFSSLAVAPNFATLNGPYTCAIVEGAHATMVCGSTDDTFALPLPTQK